MNIKDESPAASYIVARLVIKYETRPFNYNYDS